MPKAPKTFRTFSTVSTTQPESTWASRLTDYRHWYNLPVWKHPRTGLRGMTLRREPICRRCNERGRPGVPATQADHIIPHNGDWSLFIDLDNLQGLCARCHSIKTINERRARKAK